MIHRKWDRPPITILLKQTLCFFVGLSLETPYLVISLNLNLGTFHVNFNWNELKWARISGAFHLKCTNQLIPTQIWQHHFTAFQLAFHLKYADFWRNVWKRKTLTSYGDTLNLSFFLPHGCVGRQCFLSICVSVYMRVCLSVFVCLSVCTTTFEVVNMKTLFICW